MTKYILIILLFLWNIGLTITWWNQEVILKALIKDFIELKQTVELSEDFVK